MSDTRPTPEKQSQQKVSFVTLGCKVNQYETQSFRESFETSEYSEVEKFGVADVYVINACVVTHRAESDSKAAVRRALRQNPKAKIIATGCLTDENKAELRAMPNVTVVENTDKNQVPFVADSKRPAPSPSSVQGMGISNFKGRARAFVKVQDGCALNCSFCIIPKVRGKLRSRKIADIQAEVEALADNGYREIVLTGVHLGHFGRGKGERERLHQLMQSLSRVDGIERIRLSSIESVELKPAVLDVLSSSEKFCPHFHLPLQSGNDRVLEAMRRRYTVSEFMAGIEELWRRFDRPSLSTDVIIGFPTESDDEFQDTLKIMKAAGFGRSHVFSYSDREGTDATLLTPKTPPEVIKARTREAIQVGDRLAWRYSQSFMGEPVPVLIERQEKDGTLSGYSDRYIRVRIAKPADSSADFWLRKIVPVKISEVDEKGLAKGFVDMSRAQIGAGDKALTRP